MKLSRSELKQIDIYPMSITITEEFRDVLGKPGVHEVIDWNFQAVAGKPLTLNKITVHFNGDICVTRSGMTWFSGSTHISDDYDFDIRWFDGVRSVGGEIKTILTNWGTRGNGFPITNDPLPFFEITPPVSADGGIW